MEKKKYGFMWGALAVLASLMLIFEYAGIEYSPDEKLNTIIRMVLTRGVGSVIFTVLLIYRGFGVLNPFRVTPGSTVLFILPSLLVVINNLPIISLATGSAYLDATPLHYWLFALECLFTGWFEETAFRGVLFLVLLEGARRTRRDIVRVTVISSAVFGGVHLLNLLARAGIGSVILQVGYSFLIGGMCAIVLLKTKNIWFCVLLHALYNFCGLLVERLGGGEWWDMPTVIITAALAVAVTAIMLTALLKLKPEDIDDIFVRGKADYADCT